MKKSNRSNRVENLSQKPLYAKILLFISYLIFDVFSRIKNKKSFAEFGLTLYCGRQGAGKTMAMTEYLERMRKKYPDVIYALIMVINMRHFQ